jgi:hypothetical protein
VQTRAEFIEEHWEEALAIDAKMRDAAVACVKNFLGEGQEVPVLLSKDKLIASESTTAHFMNLAYWYSLKALDQRYLYSRVGIEFLFMLIIRQATLGEAAVVVSNTTKYTSKIFFKVWRIPKNNGADRLQFGQSLTQIHYEMLGKIPRSYRKMREMEQIVKRKMPAHIWKTLIRQRRRTKEESEAKREREAQAIQVEIKTICDEWGLECLPEADFDGWMFEEFLAKDAGVS